MARSFEAIFEWPFHFTMILLTTARFFHYFMLFVVTCDNFKQSIYARAILPGPLRLSYRQTGECLESNLGGLSRHFHYPFIVSNDKPYFRIGAAGSLPDTRPVSFPPPWRS